MNPILYLLIGAVFSAALSVPATLVVERRRGAERSKHDLAGRRDEARNTRQLLHQENQHNLGQLMEYMRRVEYEPPREGYQDLQEMEWRLRVVERDLPEWSHDFRSQLTPYLPLALSKSEIARLLDLHAGLDRLTALRANLQQAFTDDMRAIAVRARTNPDLERIGNNWGDPNDPKYQDARAFANKLRESNQQTEGVRRDFQNTYNQLMPMADLLVGDIPPGPPQPPTSADRLRRMGERIADWLPVQVTWRRRDASTTTGKVEPR
jgi:hypothetical protein